jgi:hypothetical protein
LNFKGGTFVSESGYIRVSSAEQNENRQLDAMARVPCGRHFIDRQSGKNFARPEYIRMINTLRSGDLLYVPSITRLGHKYDEMADRTAAHKAARADCVDRRVIKNKGISQQNCKTFCVALTLA